MAKKKVRGRNKVHTVMAEFKRGTLRSGSGEKVKSRKQAIAIAMSEAGISRKKTGSSYYGPLPGSRDLMNVEGSEPKGPFNDKPTGRSSGVRRVDNTSGHRG